MLFVVLLDVVLGFARTPALLLLRDGDTDPATSTGSPGRAGAGAEGPPWFAHRNHYSVVEVIAFCRTVATDTWRATVRRQSARVPGCVMAVWRGDAL